MIMETRYKDRPAVALESRELRAVFLPEDGAKLASLCFGEKELLEQAKGIEYLRLHRNSEYVTCECSAFDDMFPTIDPCILNGHFYPDHGEVCRIPHTCLVTQNKVFFTCCSESVNADFSKSVWVEANALFIQYRIHNRNESPLPYLWAGHMMFAGSCGARVISCFPPDSEKRVMFGAMPENPHILGAFSPHGESYKYYINAAKTPLSCGILYTNGEKITVSFEGEAVRYLGVWMNNGSFKQMYNIALEPCTAPFDSPENAEKEGCASVLPPKGTIQFTMKITCTDKGEDVP